MFARSSNDFIIEEEPRFLCDQRAVVGIEVEANRPGSFREAPPTRWRTEIFLAEALAVVVSTVVPGDGRVTVARSLRQLGGSPL
jgi:hypothetical protein